MTPDFQALRGQHANCQKNGLPVVPWDDFEAAARDLLAADTDLRDTLAEVWRIQQPLDRSAEWGLTWLAWSPEPVQELFLLNQSDMVPCFLHQRDLKFRLTYGAAKRNPLGYMAGRARKLRAAAARIRRELEKLRPRLAELAEERGGAQ